MTDIMILVFELTVNLTKIHWLDRSTLCTKLAMLQEWSICL